MLSRKHFPSTELGQLVFLPGASGDLSFWQPVLQQLVLSLNLKQDQAQIVPYPEFGGHPAHPNVHRFEDLQQLVLDQIEQPSILIAQSMGGIFAVQAALHKPQHVQALVLVATSGGIDLTPYQVKDWREEYQQNFTVPDWFVKHHSALDDQLDQIQCPVLLIWGDADPISPVDVGQYLQQKIMDAELKLIAGGQHDLAYKHATQVATWIHDFIQQRL
ncbi:alpha/beta fold hydrolase [Acinetobacter shaoyimingii]|uniref:Alpha/beta hydrolase n=1 Tax=Acinetobacter shaoyimingii TaxID=2715164 RepID=A0A6G8RRI1_9GAMM|nr:alpha/beta hydrolase [Acinetobacter shaoyimingii]QIO04579.1 alpha/beta hydrolase [Acinetobacter shaoyimingii]